jgi:hypothetical protein
LRERPLPASARDELSGQGGRTNDPSAVATPPPTQRQRSATTAVTPPPAAAIETRLVAACQLLNNPLGPHTSPSAVGQWHHDVDQLVVATINIPSRGGWRANHSSGRPELSTTHSRTPTTAHASLTAHAPTMPHVPATSIATIDHWAELESHSERRHNLEGDYGTPITAPVACATHTSSSPGVTCECMPLASHLHMGSGHASSGPTYWRSTMGPSTPSSSCLRHL